MADILFKTNDYIFSYRVGGVLIHNDKMLLQRVPGDDGYAFIGGHVAFGETTAETLIREFKEELRADIKVECLSDITIYPAEAKEHIINIPKGIVHFVYKE